jgi:hypothetical protein
MATSRAVADQVALNTTTRNENEWYVLPDPGDTGIIAPTTNCIVDLTIAAGDVMTVAAPVFNGQKLCIHIISDTSGTVAITFPADFTGVSGDDVYTPVSIGDMATFVACDVSGTLTWRLIGGDLAAALYGTLVS